MTSSLPLSWKKCRNCMQDFDPEENSDKACKYHPESFTGETAQRWLAPGDTKGGGDVHFFWSCCGSEDKRAVGCCYSRHVQFGEPDDVVMRRPGMGVEEEERKGRGNVEEKGEGD